MDSWESADHTIKKNILRSGNFSTKPTERAVCRVVIENISVMDASLDELRTLYNSEIFDGSSSIEKELTLGDASAEIDRKVERAIQMMMIGETSLIEMSIPSVSSSRGDTILVLFEVTLKHFEPHKPIWEWSPEEKYDIALKYKECGINLFKQSRYVDAFYKFSRACKILITLEPVEDLELDKELESKIDELRFVLYNNMAGCQLHRENYEHTVTLCDKVLNKDKNNVKALYRRGVAYGRVRNFEKAVPDLKTAVELEPHNTAAKEQYLLYNTKFQEACKKSNDIAKKMMVSYLKMN